MELGPERTDTSLNLVLMCLLDYQCFISSIGRNEVFLYIFFLWLFALSPLTS